MKYSGYSLREQEKQWEQHQQIEELQNQIKELKSELKEFKTNQKDDYKQIQLFKQDINDLGRKTYDLNTIFFRLLPFLEAFSETYEIENHDITNDLNCREWLKAPPFKYMKGLVREMEKKNLLCHYKINGHKRPKNNIPHNHNNKQVSYEFNEGDTVRYLLKSSDFDNIHGIIKYSKSTYDIFKISGNSYFLRNTKTGNEMNKPFAGHQLVKVVSDDLKNKHEPNNEIM